MRSCGAVVPQSVSDELASLVHRRSEGNPLFARAITKDLLHAGFIEHAADAWMLAGQASDVDRCLPHTLRQLVDVQLGALDDDDRRIVEAAATTGLTFTADEVASCDPGRHRRGRSALRPHEPRRRLLCARANVAWPDGSASAGFAFVHALYWEAVIDRVPEARRAEWHKRIAERAERIYGADRDHVSVELATRFEAGGEPARATAICAAPPTRPCLASPTARRWHCCSTRPTSRWHRRCSPQGDQPAGLVNHVFHRRQFVALIATLSTGKRAVFLVACVRQADRRDAVQAGIERAHMCAGLVGSGCASPLANRCSCSIAALVQRRAASSCLGGACSRRRVGSSREGCACA